MTDSFQQSSREWWAQRWIDVLESFGWVRRLARARVYAREGNVLSIEFKGSKVFARVQGTAPEPYKVTLSLDSFTDEQWSYIIESMSQRAIFSAKLLAGEMPQSIEDVFTANGLSLFPFTKFDIHSRCSCPDPANPCKHIGAVYYLLGDRFSEDPFVLFQLRGRTKEQIIDALRQIRGQAGAEQNSTPNQSDSPHPSPHPHSVDFGVNDSVEHHPLAEHSGNELFDQDAQSRDQPNRSSRSDQDAHSNDTYGSPLPTPLNLTQFWQYTDQLEPSLVVIAPLPGSETVLDVLGPIPLRTEDSSDTTTAQTVSQTTMDYLKTLYQSVSEQAVLAGMNIGDGEK